MPNSTFLVHLVQEMRDPANSLTAIQMYRLFNTSSTRPANQMQKKMLSCQFNLCLLKPGWSLVINDGKVVTNELQFFLKFSYKMLSISPISTLSRRLFPKLPYLSPCHLLLILTFL